MRIVGSSARDVVESQPPDRAPVSLKNAQDVGGLLREARERRGISLDRLAQSTRIRMSLLHAIESNQIDAIPQAIFLRGFLRAYAREVGLDPEQTVQCYLDQFAPPPTAVENPTPTVQNAPYGAGQEINWRAIRTLGGLLVIAIVVILYGIGSWHTRPGASPATPAAPPAASAPQEVGTAGSTATAPVAAAGHVLHVALKTTATCWVAATADGTQVVYKLLPAGEQRAFDVKEQAEVRIGNPAAVDLSIDGVPVRTLGPAGQAVSLRITKDNFRDYLKR